MGVEKHLQDSSRAELPLDHLFLPPPTFRTLYTDRACFPPVFKLDSDSTPNLGFISDFSRRDAEKKPLQIRLKLASNWTRKTGFRLDKKPVSKGFRTETQIAVQFEFQSEVESESNLNPI